MAKKKAVEGDLYLALVLDESGSRAPHKEDVIAGVNALLDEQQAIGERLGAKTYVSLTRFSYTATPTYIGAPIDFVERLSSENYRPSGGTALYDAIAQTILAVERMTKRPERVMVAIDTDGEENASKSYSGASGRQRIFDLVQRKQKEGWLFQFLGCDIDAYKASSSIGVSPQHTVGYQHGLQATMGAYTNVSSTSTMYRNGTLRYNNDLTATAPSPAANTYTITYPTVKVGEESDA